MAVVGGSLSSVKWMSAFEIDAAAALRRQLGRIAAATAVMNKRLK